MTSKQEGKERAHLRDSQANDRKNRERHRRKTQGFQSRVCKTGGEGIRMKKNADGIVGGQSGQNRVVRAKPQGKFLKIALREDITIES